MRVCGDGEGGEPDELTAEYAEKKDKKMTMKTKRGILAGLLCISGVIRCVGQLTATVTPGYSFSDGERPTVGTLNQLGTPTVEIAGTVSGSVGLAAGTVSGVHLTDSVVDGRFTVYTNSTPRAITIARYQTILWGITTNVTLSVAHGLVATPGMVRAVLVCTDAGGDNGYSQNDEVGVEGVYANPAAGGAALVPIMSYGANATTVFATAHGTAGEPWAMRTKGSTSSTGNITASKWMFRIYVRM